MVIKKKKAVSSAPCSNCTSTFYWGNNCTSVCSRNVLLFIKRYILNCLFVFMPHAGSSFPHQGLSPHPLHWNYKALTTGLPGKSKIGIFKKINWFNHFIKDILKFPLGVVGRMQLPPVQAKVPAAVFHHCPCIISVQVSIVKKATSILILSWNSSDLTDSLRRSLGPSGVSGPRRSPALAFSSTGMSGFSLPDFRSSWCSCNRAGRAQPLAGSHCCVLLLSPRY